MKFLTGCAFLCLSLSANAVDVLELNVGSKDSGFVVTLDANPSTGYTWSVLDYDKNLLTLESSQFQKNESKLIGSGGHMLFLFSLNKGKIYPQSTDMTFKYARSWEPRTETFQKVTVHFMSVD